MKYTTWLTKKICSKFSTNVLLENNNHKKYYEELQRIASSSNALYACKIKDGRSLYLSAITDDKNVDCAIDCFTHLISEYNQIMEEKVNFIQILREDISKLYYYSDDFSMCGLKLPCVMEKDKNSMRKYFPTGFISNSLPLPKSGLSFYSNYILKQYRGLDIAPNGGAVSIQRVGLTGVGTEMHRDWHNKASKNGIDKMLNKIDQDLFDIFSIPNKYDSTYILPKPRPSSSIKNLKIHIEDIKEDRKRSKSMDLRIN